MLPRAFSFCLCVIASALILGGCKPKPIPEPTLTDAQKKFEKKCREEYSLNVRTRMAEKTMWIYMPTSEPIFDFAAESPSAPGAVKKPSKYDLRFVDGNFKKPAFSFEYDIIPKTKSDFDSYGIRNEGTDAFNKIYNSLFTAVTECLFDIPGKPISFVVIVITDIKKGIEARYTFFLEDYRKVSSEGMPYDEFSKRILQESKGSTDYIGDEIGTHLEYTPVIMPEFLTKQMINRIRFKFTQSDFPPGEEYEDTIVGIIADTTRYYDFTDFTELRMQDLRTKKKMIFNRDQLRSFGEDRPDNKPTPPKGKLIHIIFENGQAHVLNPDTPADKESTTTHSDTTATTSSNSEK